MSFQVRVKSETVMDGLMHLMSAITVAERISREHAGGNVEIFDTVGERVLASVCLSCWTPRVPEIIENARQKSAHKLPPFMGPHEGLYPQIESLS